MSRIDRNPVRGRAPFNGTFESREPAAPRGPGRAWPRLCGGAPAVQDLLPSSRRFTSHWKNCACRWVGPRQRIQADVREVVSSISALGFCVPFGKDNLVLDGAIRTEAARRGPYAKPLTQGEPPARSGGKLYSHADRISPEIRNVGTPSPRLLDRPVVVTPFSRVCLHL